MRAAVAITIITEGASYLNEHSTPALATWIVSLSGIAGGVLLLIGFLTPAVAALAGVGSVGISLSWLPTPTFNLFDAELPAILILVMGIAVFLLGPGAFSLDARLFGRREIIIPPRSRSLES